MLDGFSFGVHLVNIDAGDTRVTGCIRQQIDEIDMGEHIIPTAMICGRRRARWDASI